MAAIRELLFFSLSVCNTILNGWESFNNRVTAFTNAIWNYITGVTNQWYFLTGTNMPIPASYYRNHQVGLQTPHTIKWKYDSGSRTLTRNPMVSNRELGVHTFDWLSVSVQAGQHEFSLDNWIPHFSYQQSNDTWFNPRILVSCWSIDSKIWLTTHDDVTLHIITDTGDRYSFPLFNDEYDVDEWLLCLGDDATDEDTETEELEVSETDESDEGEEDEDGDGEEDEDGDGEDVHPSIELQSADEQPTDSQIAESQVAEQQAEQQLATETSPEQQLPPSSPNSQSAESQVPEQQTEMDVLD